MTREAAMLLGVQGERALARTLRKRSLLGFDFDGTLAPIVPRPDDARVAPEVAGRLERLARLRPLAIITGRSVEDVRPRLGFTPQFIVGNHGAEESGWAPPAGTAPLEALLAVLQQQAATLQAEGIQVEDKRYSIALHYRQAADPVRARARLARLLADLPETLSIVGGKCVLNVVLAHAPNKFDAMSSLVRRAHCETAIFLGDDVNDEVVFVRAPPAWLTIRVGRDDPQSRAAHFLDSFEDVAPLLDRMLRLLEGEPSGTTVPAGS
jgi:trehalose 6-phosphate phosphatase